MWRMMTRSTFSKSGPHSPNDQEIQTAVSSPTPICDERRQPTVPLENTDQRISDAQPKVRQPTSVQSSQKNSVMLNSLQNRLYKMISTKALQDHIKNHNLLEVRVTPQTKSSKNLDYVVGGPNGKTLYCKTETMVPFTFTYAKECDPRSRILVRAEFTEDRYINKPVERCPNHLVKDGSCLKKHFVRCEHSQTEYLDSSEDYTLRIPLCDSTGFMFTCFSSCSGGINRRQIQLTFALERDDGSRLAMSSVPLKVCANPIRDAFKEQKLFRHRRGTLDSDLEIQRKMRQRDGNDACIRPQCRSDLDDRSQLFECVFTDPRSMRKYLWYLANEEKFEKLICMDLDSHPFRDTSVITAYTATKAWLAKRDIGFASHADKFGRHSISTLGDLAKVYHDDSDCEETAERNMEDEHNS